jgi:hypothetical protein
MDSLDGVTILEEVSLESPVLIVMLTGWIDASGAAAAAMSLVENESSARPIARFDPDLFIDYRARRPTMELREGVSTRLVWPGIELKAGKDLDGRDVLLLTGHEPDASWRRFSSLTTQLAVELGTRMMIGFGAYPFATPHTRPSRVSCTTPSIDLARSVPYLRNSVDVPAGAAAALEHAFFDRGVPAIGLWVQVPHYVATMPYPAASAALVRGAGDTGGVRFETMAFDNEAVVQRTRLDELVGANDEHVAMVEQLERAYDALEPVTPTAAASDPDRLPTGDELAAEVERFLREQGT